jgi:hypothetical protein
MRSESVFRDALLLCDLELLVASKLGSWALDNLTSGLNDAVGLGD